MMKVIVTSFEKWLEEVGRAHNPPIIRDQKEENHFQGEIRRHYADLTESLSAFGEEGDYYGISDFAVRPILKDFPTVKVPPAPHVKQFDVYIISRKFYKCDYLRVLRDFLRSSAPAYRIVVESDCGTKWSLGISITADIAHLYCSNDKELRRVKGILAEL